MLCQNCRKNNANVQYIQIVNGVKKQMILCEECAERMGINKIKINTPVHFSNLLDNFFDDEPLISRFIQENRLSSYNDIYDDFMKHELLKSIEEFNNELNSEFEENFETSSKKKLNLAKKMQNIGENIIKKEKKINNECKNNIAQLKKDLEKAIKEERYEDAAKIRDKIKKINDQ